jgi:hypothetical protein
MTIAALYEQYQLMPNLQEHQYRVTGVAALLCDHLQVKLDREEILQACLLHDMGNIVKFDLLYFPEFLEPKGLAYWQGVQNEFIKKYGDNAHHATIKIVKELGISQRVVELIDAISFNQEKQNYEGNDFSKKICAYADMRVLPHGVRSLQERFDDGQKRYAAKHPQTPFFFAMSAYLKKIETQLFEQMDILPQAINDSTILPYMASFPDMEM